jgi:3-hydroxybutyryl-CoA dehydrogenase
MSIAHGIRTLGVLGTGQMGNVIQQLIPPFSVLTFPLTAGTGIAFVAALRAKVPVLVHDRSADQITKGLALMDKLLAKDVNKGKIEAIDAKEARERVQVVPPEVGLKGLRDVDMIIEVRRFNDI